MSELIDARNQICIIQSLVTYCKSLYQLELARVKSRPLYQRRDGVLCNVFQSLIPCCHWAAACCGLPELGPREIAMVCVGGHKSPDRCVADVMVSVVN